MIRFAPFLMLLVAVPALAQQQPTAFDRVSVAYGQCIGQAQLQVDQLAELQKQLSVAQAKIKELEASAKPAEK